VAKNSNERPRKYLNHAQLVQGVSQVADDSLTQGERLFLLVLAAFTLKEDPHPGNEKLAIACGITTRQGVNKIASKLAKKNLIEIVSFGNGRGKATVYRIRVEDDRFPPPKKTSSATPPHAHEQDDKPATVELPVSGDKPATPELSLPECDDSGNPQLGASPRREKPATEPSETRNSGVAHEFKDSNRGKDPNTTNPRKTRAAKPAAPGETSVALPDWIPAPLWAEFLNGRKIKPNATAQELLIQELADLKQQGHDPVKVLQQSIARGYPGFHPLTRTGNPNLTDNQKLGLTLYGNTVADRNAKQIRTFEALGYLDKGSYQKIKKELLARGGNFEDDASVIAMCDAMSKTISRPFSNDLDSPPTEQSFCAVCEHNKSWHSRPLANRLQEEPGYMDHEFVARVAQ
jgi:hypothetical protein